MAKTAAVQFSCTECGYSAGRWFGKCPGCSAFGTLVEEPVEAAGGGGTAVARTPLRLIEVEADEAARIPTGISELDRVLGGGLVALRAMSTNRSCLLITGEESVAQVKLRAERLGGAGDIQILAETELETVC